MPKNLENLSTGRERKRGCSVSLEEGGQAGAAEENE